MKTTLFYANAPKTANGDYAHNGDIDVKCVKDNFYAKWCFQSHEEYHKITIEKLPYHHRGGERLALTFTFGGWRYWLDDVVENEQRITRRYGDWNPMYGCNMTIPDVIAMLQDWANSTPVVKLSLNEANKLAKGIVKDFITGRMDIEIDNYMNGLYPN